MGLALLFASVCLLLVKATRRYYKLHYLWRTTLGPGGENPVPGFHGRDPAGVIRVNHLGMHVVGYHSTRSFVELEAEDFTNYVREEGLEHIILQRKNLNETSARAREYFSRCVKSLIQVGQEGAANAYSMVLGFPLELIAEANAYKESSVPVRILFRARALSGALVVAYPYSNPDQPLRGRTDGEGRVVLELSPDRWLIKTVHMERLNGDPDADWESWWASLTFLVR